MPDYVISARNKKNNDTFGSEPGPSSLLVIPDGEQPKQSQGIENSKWAKKVIAEARKGVDKNDPTAFGNILVFVHGYNNSQKTVMERHRQLRDDIKKSGIPCVVVSFDWPSGDVGILYLEDRIDAKKSAMQLVTDGILLLANNQAPDCNVNVHVLAHSMGALVVREAFDDADDRGSLTGMSWIVSQMMLIAGDISAGSLSAGNSSSESLYRHVVRLTNYSSSHDGVLALSNAKRVGVAPRVGRHGLPSDAPSNAVNVDCSDYWKNERNNRQTIGNSQHSWHIGDPVFTQDMIAAISGIDRGSMPTRTVRNGKLVLQTPV